MTRHIVAVTHPVVTHMEASTTLESGSSVLITFSLWHSAVSSSRRVLLVLPCRILVALAWGPARSPVESGLGPETGNVYVLPASKGSSTSFHMLPSAEHPVQAQDALAATGFRACVAVPGVLKRPAGRHFPARPQVRQTP
jgi:hypothetical protein